MMDDAELMGRYLDMHSEAAFSELVQRHFPTVFFAALRQVGGDPHRARDIAQIVFIELARRAPKLISRSSIAGWLYCTTRFAALHVTRTERRREKREQEAYSMQKSCPDDDATIEWERLKPVVDDVLHALNAKDREVVLMRFFHGKPFTEIGASLGTTADAARFRVDRALTRMRVGFSKRGITSTSAVLAMALTSQSLAAPPAGLATAVASAALNSTALAVGLPASLGTLGFMSSSKTILGVIVVLLGATAMGEGWRAWSQTHELRQLRFATVNTEGKRLAQQIEIAERQVAALARREALLTAAAKRKFAIPTAPSPGPDLAVFVAKQRTAANFSQAFTMAMEDPEFRKLMAISEKARLNLFYDPLFKRLALGPEQLDRFKELLVDRQQSIGDANRSALASGIDPTAAESVIASAQQEIDSDIRSLLGETGYADYRRYEETRGQQVTVDLLRQSLTYTSAPLNDVQSSRLVDLLSQNSSPSARPSTIGLGAQVGAGLRSRDLSAPITERAIQASEAVLSPLQIDALRQLQNQQQERQRIEQSVKQMTQAPAAVDYLR